MKETKICVIGLGYVGLPLARLLGVPCQETALGQLIPRIQALDFKALIDETPYLTPLQRGFYVQYLKRRREVMFQ